MSSLIGYPTLLPSNTKVFNFTPINCFPYNANYDIVWSFEFNLCGSNTEAQGGFTTFLMQAPAATAITSSILTGGNVGIDLGYSGLSANSLIKGYTNTGLLSTTYVNGISNTILGIGFDTTGLFALSAQYVNGASSYTRSGVGLDLTKKNSLIIRGSSPNYPLLYNNELSALNTGLNLLDNTGTIFNTVRFRLGNIGRTLFVDYKPINSTGYINLLTLPVNLNVVDTTVYAIGISFASPVSGLSANTITNFRVKNFHIEGRTDPTPLYYNIDNGTSTSSIFNLITETYTVTGAPDSNPLTSSTCINGKLSGLLDVLGENNLYVEPLTGQTIYDTISGTVFFV